MRIEVECDELDDRVMIVIQFGDDKDLHQTVVLTPARARTFAKKLSDCALVGIGKQKLIANR